MTSRSFLPVAFLLLGAAVQAAPAQSTSLQSGTPDIQFAGPMTFGPDGILFVADPRQAALYALDTGEKGQSSPAAKVEVENINKSIAEMLGVMPSDVMINDMAVNPESGSVYLSVSRGRGPDAAPAILKVDSSGKLAELSLKKIPFAKATFANAPAPGGEGRQNRRAQSITDLAYVDGHIFVAGLSNEEFASTLRSLSYPFQSSNEQTAAGTSVEIYHGAHGKFETHSPIRTFVPYVINGESHLLAAYTCTPLVKFRVSDLESAEKAKGTTIAELGNRNTPLDMVLYKKNGQEYLLIANTNRGVMKVTTEKIADQEGITERISDTAGLKYETIADWKNVQQLDRLNDSSVVLLVTDDAGSASLKTMPLP